MPFVPTGPSQRRGTVRVTLVGAGVLACCLAGNPALHAQSSVHGGIEIGAKGVKATVIRVSPGQEGFNTTPLLPPKTANTTLAALKDGRFRPDAIQETAEEVEKFYQQMQKDFKVPADHIYIVGSSGLPRPPNQDALIRAIKDRTGKDLRFINARTEVALMIAGVVKPELRADSVLVDIGSGSTKGGYFEQAGPGAEPRLVAFSLPLGTVTYTTRVKKEGGGSGRFAETADRLREEVLTRPLADAVRKDPGLASRKRVYLQGGIVWAMVTLLRPETIDESFVRLAPEDVERFHQLVTKTPNAFPNIDLNQIKDEKLRARAGKDLRHVRDTFTPENLVAGSEILGAVASALPLRDREVFFPRYGYIAWIQSYVEEKGIPSTGDTKPLPRKEPDRPPTAEQPGPGDTRPPRKEPDRIPTAGMPGLGVPGQEMGLQPTVSYYLPPSSSVPTVYYSLGPSWYSPTVSYYPAPSYDVPTIYYSPGASWSGPTVYYSAPSYSSPYPMPYSYSVFPHWGCGFYHH